MHRRQYDWVSALLEESICRFQFPNLVLIVQEHLESGLDHSCVFGAGQRNRIAASECRTRALVDGLDADAFPCDRIER